MSLTSQRITTNPIKQFITELLIVVLLLKAFIPLGYMPDMQKLADGVVSITICTASGVDTLLVDTHKSKQHTNSNSFCPFGWSQTQHTAHHTVAAFLQSHQSQDYIIPHHLALHEWRFQPQQARAPPLSA